MGATVWPIFGKVFRRPDRVLHRPLMNVKREFEKLPLFLKTAHFNLFAEQYRYGGALANVWHELSISNSDAGDISEKKVCLSRGFGGGFGGSELDENN